MPTVGVGIACTMKARYEAVQVRGMNAAAKRALNVCMGSERAGLAAGRRPAA